MPLIPVPTSFKLQPFRDTDTRNRVYLLTTGLADHYLSYPYNCCWSKDDTHLVIASNRSGSVQLYVVEIETGRVWQLTRREEIGGFSYRFFPDGEHVLYVSGSRFFRVNIHSGEDTLFFDPYACGLAGPVHSVFLDILLEPYVAVIRPDPDAAARVYLWDHRANRLERVHTFPEGMRHAHFQRCPSDPDLLAFCPLPDHQNDFSLAPAERSRTDLLHLPSGMTRPFIVAPIGHRAVHEYWAPDGSGMYLHLKSVPDWVPCSIAWQGLHDPAPRRLFSSDSIHMGHSMCHPTEPWIVIDSQQPKRNELLVHHVPSGETRLICFPNASGAPHPLHVHPVFSRTGRWIAFNSDFSGNGQLYLLPFPQCLEGQKVLESVQIEEGTA